MPRRLLVVVASVVVSSCTLQRWQPSQPAQALTVDDHVSHMSAADRSAPLPGLNSRSAERQGTPGLPPSAAAAEARLKSSPRHAEWVKVAWEPGSKDSLMAWIVYPQTRTKAPVVVVVHEILGLSTWIRGVTDQVAADGFIAIAPDFLSRVRGGPSADELRTDTATRLIRGVDATERNRAIIAAANYAMMQPSAEQRYAVIGYCWGGQTTFFHAINGGVKGFTGGVAFYGLPYTSGGQAATATTAAVPLAINADSLAKVKAPVMLLNGSRDTRIAAAMPQLDSLMKALGKSYVGKNYEGAIHGFLRAQDDPPTGQNPPETAPANLAASKDAWPLTIAFLKKNLGTK